MTPIPWHRTEGDYHRARLRRGRRLFIRLLRARLSLSINPALDLENAVVAVMKRGLYSRKSNPTDVAWSLMKHVYDDYNQARWPRWWGFVRHYQMRERVKREAA